MEDKLLRKTDEIIPRGLTFKLLEDITHSFSENQKVGQGGYGQVYKGILPDGEEIAVKKLYNMVGIDDVEFTNEFNSLMKVKHQNIVRLVGYCFDVQKKPVKLPNGDYVFANLQERALCFEYLQLGSLDKHLSDETCGLDWNTRYKIIKGVCEGLNHLHNGSKDHIYHLDLKPANILLDKNMAPKIADFGLSRLFASTQTHLTTNLKGTEGYMPPEYIDKRQISKKFDVYSLGVIIIAIIAGPKGASKCAEMPSQQQFIELVHGNWKKRWNATSSNASDEAYSLEVTTCLQIALKCVEKDRAKRPTIREIVDKMNEIDIIVKRSLTGQLRRTECKEFLGVDPHELRFPFEMNEEISCVLQLTNNSDDLVEFHCKTNQKKYSTQPDKGVMAAWSKCYVIVTMKPQEKPLPSMQCNDVFVVRSTRVREDAGDDADDDDIASPLDRIHIAEQLSENLMCEVKLPIVYVAFPPPPSVAAG